MQKIEPVSIDWRDVKGLFAAPLASHQTDSRASLLAAEFPDLGVAVYWYLAPLGHYLFFAPRFRIVERWRNLSEWHKAFFAPDTVAQIKRFARKQRWPVRRLPVLAQLNVEALADFGSDFEGWNELAALEEYVLARNGTFSEQLLDYLREWERTFEPYVYRELTSDSPVARSATADLTLALHAVPLTTEPSRLLEVAAACAKRLEDVMSRWSESEVLGHLFVQDVCPIVQRHDLLRGFSMPEDAKDTWDRVYELRVAFLEKFLFPWFYDPLLAMLGAEGGKTALSAEQLVEQGVPPLAQPICPPELQSRIGRAALKLERTYCTLTRRPIAGILKL